eukprot:1151119-Pelagomonas_calceolata.AAC.6
MQQIQYRYVFLGPIELVRALCISLCRIALQGASAPQCLQEACLPQAPGAPHTSEPPLSLYVASLWWTVGSRGCFEVLLLTVAAVAAIAVFFLQTDIPPEAIEADDDMGCLQLLLWFACRLIRHG